MKAELHRGRTYDSLVEEGAALFAKGEHVPALIRFWKAFELRPSAPVVLFNIARTMEELKDLRAEHFYAAAATQGNVDAFYQLGTLCLGHGRTEEAADHLSAFLRQYKGAEDQYTLWARNTIQKLCPRPVLVWSEGKRLYAD